MLTTAIKDVLIMMNLPFEKLCGKCYDMASTMTSSKRGVAKRISDLETRAVYTHCYGHALNLAAADTLKQSKLMKDALDTTREKTKIIKYQLCPGTVRPAWVPEIPITGDSLDQSLQTGRIAGKPGCCLHILP